MANEIRLFDGVVDEFLADLFEESPQTATMLGVDGFDDQSADLSADGFERRDRSDDSWLARFESLADDDLAPEERIDRDLALSHLRGRSVLRDWQSWRRNPDTYLNPGLGGVFALFMHRLHPERELAAAAETRLSAVPEQLNRGIDNLDPELASPVLVERALGQCRAAVGYSRDLVPEEVTDPDLRQSVADAGERAAAAYERFADHLEDLGDRAVGSYAIGGERYSALLTQKELLGYDVEELRIRGRAAYAALEDEMRSVALDLRGTDDWRTVVDELNADHPDSPESMLDGYTDWTQRCRRFLVDHELVTFPEGEECRVVPSPVFQRPVLAVASYFRPPAFRPSRTGHFFVPYPPDATPAEEVAARLRNNSWNSMPSIAAHEAYPGHHWHLTVAKESRPLRRVLSSTYFVEGWGLYSELLMREQGFFSDLAHELCHLDMRIFRAARIVVDTSLHLGEMSFDGAVEYMRDNASLSEPNARAEVARYCSWPTQASAYLTGSLEIERMRTAYLTDGGDLRSFHDALAATGAMPIALAERELAAHTPSTDLA